MKNLPIEFEVLVAKLALGLLPTENLADIAYRLLEDGYDSPGLLELVTFHDTHSGGAESLALFRQVLQEIGVSLPDKRSALLLFARGVAKKILEGELTPYQGGKQIWQLTSNADRVDPELAPFIYAASEWEDHPDDRLFYEQLILKTAKELVGGK